MIYPIYIYIISQCILTYTVGTLIGDEYRFVLCGIDQLPGKQRHWGMVYYEQVTID